MQSSVDPVRSTETVKTVFKRSSHTCHIFHTDKHRLLLSTTTHIASPKHPFDNYIPHFHHNI